MGMILRIASSRIVGQGDIVGRSGYFSLNLSANSVMRGRLDARRTLKSLVADLRIYIFAPNGYSSQYSRGEYSRAKKEKEEAKSDLNKYTKKLSEQLAFLKENVAKYHKGEFTGWAVSHRFRSLNGAGSMTIPGEMIFFCDEEFTTCGGYETDKFEDFVKILNAVDEATSDEDVIDYFKENNFLL